MTALTPSLLSLALCLTLAAPTTDAPDVPEQSKRIYVGNLPFASAAPDASVQVGVEEGDPAPARIALGTQGRLGSSIPLAKRGAMYAGQGTTPAGRYVRTIRIWTEAGDLTLEFRAPPTNQGWDEGVAAFRFHYAPANGRPIRGQGQAQVEVEGDVLGFNIGMPPTWSWGA